MSRKPRPKKFLWLIYIMLVILITYGLSHILKLSQIDCFTQFSACPEDIQSQLDTLMGNSLINPFLNRNIKSKIAAFPEISALSIRRSWPSTVIVTVVTRKPLGLLFSQASPHQELVDEAGQVYEQVENSTLPSLQVASLTPTGSRVDQNTLSALNVLKNLSTRENRVLTGSLINDSLSINYAPDLEIIVDCNQSLDNWFPTLQLVLNRSTIKTKVMHKIDLRFTSPIVTY